MYYLSRGLLLKDNIDSGEVFVNGGAVKVSGTELRYWRNARTSFAQPQTKQEEEIVRKMASSGLVEISVDDDENAKAELFLNSIPIVNKKTTPASVISFAEVTVYNWILKGGIHLTTAELAYLLMKNVPPTPDLTGGKNVQKLVSLLYLNYDPLDRNRSLAAVVKGTDAYYKTQDIVFSLLKQNFIYLL